jgi:hypothetical protein
MPESRTRACHSGVLFIMGLIMTGLAPISAQAQAQTVEFEVVFESTWSADTHPVDFPQGAHYSPLVGGTHDHNAVFWEPGGIATLGIERMAETGSTLDLRNEINAQITAGFADQSFVGSGINSPGTTTLNFTADLDFPELTLVTMIAPSPDWFVGLHGYPLLDQGWWINEVVVDLFAYDAGTDHGASYESDDIDAVPQVPISLHGSPFEAGVPVGTMTIRRLPEPGLVVQILATVPLLAIFRLRRRYC